MLNLLSLITGIMYMIIGAFVVTKHWFVTPLNPEVAYPLGALMIAYGVFRIVRAVYRIKQKRNEV